MTGEYYLTIGSEDEERGRPGVDSVPEEAEAEARRQRMAAVVRDGNTLYEAPFIYGRCPYI